RRARRGQVPARGPLAQVQRQHLRRELARRAREGPRALGPPGRARQARCARSRARGVRARCRGAEGDVQVSAQPTTRKPARILVVGHNKTKRLLMARGLAQQGHGTAMAENGRVALEMLRSQEFDLVVLDMEMPEMDGFQVLEQLVKDTKLRDLPVVVTSSLEGIENVVRCIELGAEDFLTKPVNPVLLKARIGASLEKKRLRDMQKELVRRFATSEVAQDLAQSGFALGGHYIRASVMFSDIRGFTSLVESQPPEETIDLLNTYYTLMFEAISDKGGVVNQMVGDGLMAIFGAPLPLPDPAGSAVAA